MSFLKSLLATILGFFISLLLMFFLSIIILAAIVAGASRKVEVKSNSILKISLDGNIPEKPVVNPFENFTAAFNKKHAPICLEYIIDDIKRAKEDSRIKGIYLEPSFAQAPLATIEEIRNALLDFKKSGKFIYAYSEIYNQKN